MRTWLIVLALVGVLAAGAMVVDGQEGCRTETPITLFTTKELLWLYELVRLDDVDKPSEMSDRMLSKLKTIPRGRLGEVAIGDGGLKQGSVNSGGGAVLDALPVPSHLPLQITGVTTGVVVMDESNNRLVAFQMQDGRLRMISSCSIYTPTKSVSQPNSGGCLGEYMSGSVDGTPRMTNPPPRRSKPISVDGVPVDRVEEEVE